MPSKTLSEEGGKMNVDGIASHKRNFLKSTRRRKEMKSVLITGAYGGMGRATAKRLAADGYRVYALDRRVLLSENESIIPIEADVTSAESIERALSVIGDGELSAIVHFAGIYMLDSLVEISEESFRRIFDINLNGVFLVNRAVVPKLSSGAKIVITTSELAPLDPLPFTGIYAITKAALDKYAYSLRMELSLLDISVSVLRAGAVDTGMIGASCEALDAFCKKTKLYSVSAENFKRVVDSVESRRVPPAKIATRVWQILKKRSPKFAYAINRNPLLLLLDALPKGMQLWVIKKILLRKNKKGK